jgi:hypothetical protein
MNVLKYITLVAIFQDADSSNTIEAFRMQAEKRGRNGKLRRLYRILSDWGHNSKRTKSNDLTLTLQMG